MPRIARIVALLFAAAPLVVAASEPPAIDPAFRYDEARQFDFWAGAWRVNLRIRQEDLSFDDAAIADARVWRILDGKATLELWDSAAIKGFSLRWFDREDDEWKLWLNWPAANRSAGSALSGRFRHGRGEFFAESTAADGATIRSRYTFSDIASDRLRWDDAYSTDGGNTWSANWIMEFTRTAAAALPPDNEDNAHTYHDGSRCTLPEFERINALAGLWRGRVQDTTHAGDQSDVVADMSIHRILDGCAVMAFLHAPDAPAATREFRLLTWNSIAEGYEENLLDNEPESPFRVRFGPHTPGGLVLQNTGAGHRARWQQAADGLLTIDEYRVPADSGSLARRRLTLRRR